MRHLLAVVLLIVLTGCGDSNSGSGFSGQSSGSTPLPSPAAPVASVTPLPSPQPSPTASPTPGPTQITLNLIREANLRAYPGATQLVRIRLRNAEGRIIVGPLERTPGRIVLDGVPSAATLLELDYVIGETILGIARIPLNLTGAPLLIDDPDFTDADKLTTLTLTPGNVSLASGGTQQLAVNGTFSDGKTYTLTDSVRYGAQNATIAEASEQGLVRALAAGDTQVTARLSGITGAANVAVRPASITRITVSPANAVVATGAEVQYQAEATLSDSSRQDVTDRVTWASSRTDVARFLRTSTDVEAVGPGVTEISATLNNVTGATTLTVTGQAALRLEIAPINATFRRHTSLPLTVNATYPDGSVKDVTSVASYTSSVPENAPVSDFGSVFGQFPGKAVITARLGELSVETEVTVDDSAPPPTPVPTPTPVVRNSGRFLARALVIPAFPVFGEPYAVARADFNGDGRQDLATALWDSFSNTTNAVQIDLNQGGGRFDFTAAPNYAVGDQPAALGSGDFNNDGDVDLVSVNTMSDNVSILTNNGAGVFTVVNVAVRNRPTAVAVADLDGDGDLDLAVTNRGPDNVSILRNNGAGVFSEGPPRPSVGAGARPAGIVAADFIGNDGLIDLVTVNPGTDNLSLLRNLGGGTFAPFTVVPAVPLGGGTNPRSVTVGNFSADTIPDLVVGLRGTDQLQLLVNAGGGTFLPGGPPVAANQPNALATGDVNNDGFADVVAALQNQAVLVLLGSAGGFPPAGITYPTGRQSSAVTVGDVNGDGRTDVVTADVGDSNLSVLQNIGAGVLTPTTVTVAGAEAQDSVVADFNGDGRMDTATVNSTGAGVPGSVMVHPGNGDGTLGAPVNLGVGLNPRALVTADFNGDGRPDLATTDRDSDGCSVFLGTAGGFAPVAFYPTGNRPRGLTAADLDGDGRVDLAVTRGGGDTVVTLRNTGGGVFGAAVPAFALPGSNPQSILAADFNKDGRLDLATGNPGDGSVSLSLNAGGMTFGAPVSASFGIDPAGIQAGDYDADGNLDIGVADQVGVLYYYPGDGAGGLNVPVPVATPPFLFGNPRALLTPDVDGDGRLDFITVCSLCRFLIVVRNLGGGTFAAPEYYEFPAGAGPRGLASGDLNGDLVPDLVLPSGNPFLQVVLGLRLP